MGLTEAEQALIAKVARLAEEEPQQHYFAGNMATVWGIEENELMKLLRRLQAMDCVVISGDYDGGLEFHPTPHAIILHQRILDRREQQASERPDRVEQALRWLRSHRVLAWVILGLMAIAFLIPVVNQALELIDKLFAHD